MHLNRDRKITHLQGECSYRRGRVEEVRRRRKRRRSTSVEFEYECL